MDFKKDKVFTAVVAVLALAFVAGVGLCVKEFVSISGTASAGKKTESALSRLVKRGDAPALTEKNVETEKKNAEKLDRAREEKIGRLAGAGAKTLAPAPAGDSTSFLSQLLGIVNSRAENYQKEKIALGDDARFFGFSRYLQNSQTQTVSPDVLPLLDSEQKVIAVLSDTLLDARKKSEDALLASGLLAADKRVPLLVKRVRREASDLPKKDGAPITALVRDELSVRETGESGQTGIYIVSTAENSRGRAFPSLRRAGVVDAVAFQICFVAPTSVFRGFISAFSEKSEYPICVRDVIVAPASAGDVSVARSAIDPVPAETPESAAAPVEAPSGFDIFGGSAFGDSASPAAAPSAPAVPVKTVVQPETLSEFTVIVEYVFPVENKSADSAGEKEGE